MTVGPPALDLRWLVHPIEPDTFQSSRTPLSESTGSAGTWSS